MTFYPFISRILPSATSARFIITGLIFTALLSTKVVDSKNNVDYSVISTIDRSDTRMVVVVDGTAHPLTRSVVDPIIHIGTAPAAKDGYYYAKSTRNYNNQTSGTSPFSAIEEREPFIRQLVASNDSSTPYEFYNRSQNSWNIRPLPQLFKPTSKRIPSNLHVEGEIGTIHILGDQLALDFLHANYSDDIQVIVDFFFIRDKEFKIFRGAELELSGRSSRFQAKPSYNLKIHKDEGTTLYGYRRLKLRALALDPSYIREAIVYKVFDSAGVATTKFSYVRVIINNQPVGLFGLVEKFKDPWLRNEFGDGDKDYKQGNLYQGVIVRNVSAPSFTYSDLRYEGDDNVMAYAQGQYKIKENPSDNEPSYQPLMELTKFINGASPDNIKEWHRHFDMDSVIRNLALEIVLGFADGYLTLADNFYVYQDGLNSKRFIFIPSDVDISLGANGVFKLEDMLSGNYSTFPHLLERPLAIHMLHVPEFKNQFETLLQLFASKLVNSVVMFSTIDDITAMIKQDVEWDRSLPRLSTATQMEMYGNTFSSVADLDPNSAVAKMNPDPDLVEEQVHIDRDSIPFDVAVNGHTGYKSLIGVKEYITNSSRAILSFYNNTKLDKKSA